MILEDVQKHRAFWQERIRTQVQELMMLSIEGNKKSYSELHSQLLNSLIVLWKLDRKLAVLLKNEKEDA